MKIRTKEHKARNSFVSISTALLAVLMISNITSVIAGPVERDQAKRIHDRLTGVPPTAADLAFMEDLIVNNNPYGGATGAKAAALYAMDPAGSSRAKYFYNVTLKNWVTPWTNVEQTMFAPLNDYTATVIGMILNNKRFDEVLSADYIYTGNVAAIESTYGITLTGYSPQSNTHYEQMESNNVDLSLYLLEGAQSDFGLAGSATDSAGVVTTRAAGEAFFKAGTNRRMLRFTLMNYMCRDLEDVKDITRVPDRIRQDVSRSPGGDSTLFLNSCIGCHAGMDPLASAYAYYEWTEDANGENGRVSYSNNVQPKYHINSTNFEFGYVTRDNSWKNYWRNGPNAALRWDPALPGEGFGAKSLGIEIAASDAFAQCQVEKVYKQVCLQDPIDVHATQIENITANFSTSYNYNMKQVFADVAALCMGN